MGRFPIELHVKEHLDKHGAAYLVGKVPNVFQATIKFLKRTNVLQYARSDYKIRSAVLTGDGTDLAKLEDKVRRIWATAKVLQEDGGEKSPNLAELQEETETVLAPDALEAFLGAGRSALGNDTAETEVGFAEVHFETAREMEEFVATVGWAVGPDEVEQS